MLNHEPMQYVYKTPSDVKKYLRDPKSLVNADTIVCRICSVPHRLRLHGTYKRWVILPEYSSGVEIVVQRLLCPATGKTVSLLPDFCLPRRQHGPWVVGVFLFALIVKGRSLLGAMHEARPEVTRHSVAQSLRDGFAGQRVVIKSYVALIHPRAIRIPATVSQEHRDMAMMLLGLLGMKRNPGKLLVHHARCIHERHQQSLLAKCG